MERPAPATRPKVPGAPPQAMTASLRYGGIHSLEKKGVVIKLPSIHRRGYGKAAVSDDRDIASPRPVGTCGPSAVDGPSADVGRRSTSGRGDAEPRATGYDDGPSGRGDAEPRDCQQLPSSKRRHNIFSFACWVTFQFL